MKIAMLWFFPFCSSENAKKHATDAQGNAQHVCGMHSGREYLKREWARHTELCLCVSQCFSAYACHTVDGTVYVWFRPCVQSLQLSLPDAPQRRPVPRLHLAGLPAALPSLCAKLNLGWRIQLVSNLLTLSREWFGGTLTNFSRCFLKKCSAKSFLIYRGWLSQHIVTVLPVIIFFLKLHF